MMITETLNADTVGLAERWAEAGVAVFPIVLTLDSDGGINKKPLTVHGHKDATCDVGEVFGDVRTLKEGETLGVGILPGDAGLIVFDVDRKHGKDGYPAADRLGIPSTCYSTTPSGGQHRFITKLDDVHVGNVSTWGSEGVDVRSDDGWVVAPGVVTPWGSWSSTLTPSELVNGAPKCPHDVWEHLVSGSNVSVPTSTIPEGERNMTLTSVAGSLRRKGMTEDEIALHLVLVNDERCDPPLDDDEVVGIAHSVGRYEPETMRNVEGAIDGYRLTDAGNSERLLSIAEGKIRYVDKWQSWIVYLGGAWHLDEGGSHVTEYAKKVAKTIFVHCSTMPDSNESRALLKHGKHCETARAIRDMVWLSRGAPSVATNHEDLDSHPYLLNVLNGTVNLQTGVLHAHDPEDLLTLQVPVNYDEDAQAPLWDACLRTWQPEPEMRAYLQLEAGAGAVGRATETLSVHYGTGANGKSKFWGAVQHALGEYACVPHKSLLMTTRNEQPTAEKAHLFRKRLAIASETKSRDRLDEEQVKSITGSDRMSVRRMRQNPWEFEPTHTMVVLTNHKPGIDGTDESVWRRVRLIPWNVTIPLAERDEDLASKLKAEAEGILVWIVEGARRLVAEGFVPPEAVKVATKAYRHSEDYLSRLVDELFEFGPSFEVETGVLLEEVAGWCQVNGSALVGMQDLAKIFTDPHGCTHQRKVREGRKVTVWAGVRIRREET